MTIEQISMLIINDQTAELKALNRVSFLRGKAKEIAEKAGGIANMTPVQLHNFNMFEEMAKEIEMLNLSKKALYNVLENLLQTLLDAQRR